MKKRSANILLLLFYSSLFLLFSFGWGCKKQDSGNAENVTQAGHLKKLLSMMTGSFDSAEQAKLDPENYYPIHLQMVPIWESRDDGPWLYVEQALETTLEKPYRQRIYRLSSGNNNTYLSEVYTLPGDPLNYAGFWQKTANFDPISPDSLNIREGCAIMLTFNNDGSFSGSTDGTSCSSQLRGATYATSEVSITDSVLISWDRGWDSDGNQVWGATEGGYVFRKK